MTTQTGSIKRLANRFKFQFRIIYARKMNTCFILNLVVMISGGLIGEQKSHFNIKT